MTGPGTDDESDDHRDESDEPSHDGSRADSPHDADRKESSPDADREEPPRDGEPTASGPDERTDETAPDDEPTGTDRESTVYRAGTDDTSEEPEVQGEPEVRGEPEVQGESEVRPGSSQADGSTADVEDAAEPEGPPIPGGEDEGATFDGPVDWFLHTNDSFVMTVRDVGSSLLTVAVLGLVLFAVSGLWPPLVAVESGSMEPHMHKNDLVFIVEEGRFVGDSAQPGTGVVTHRAAAQNEGYWSFGDYGNVVVYQPDGSERRTPIIHRARFWVEEDENWVDSEAEGGTGKANPEYLSREPSADRDFECEEIRACPADYSGFITKGDANSVYDQVGGQSDTVRPEWVHGKAKVRIPLLGWIRLQFAKMATTLGGVGPSSLGALRLQLAVAVAGVGAVVARRRGAL